MTSLLYQTLQQQQQQFKPFKINNMSTCSNCYNGCTEIVSDRCVKYTGIDVPVLGIQTGDSLSFVEQALITFLTSAIDGTGVIIDLSSINICAIVQAYLPTCKDISIADISKALIQTTCDIQVQLDTLASVVTDIEAPYTTECLTVVPGNSLTHQVVQAVIDNLCALNTEFTDFVAYANAYFINIGNIDDYIQAYLDENTSNKLYTKMIPFVVVPFYPPLGYTVGKFDGTGAGIGDWEKIYLCNGQNQTPDLRGRTTVGATDGTMNGLTMSPIVNPSVAGNPTYSVGSVEGVNEISLLDTQIPVHTHLNTLTTVFTDNGHRHKFSDDISQPTNTLRSANDIIPFATTPTNAPISATGENGQGKIYETSSEETGIIFSATLTNAPAPIGGGLPHPNIQPSSGCLYIQYRP